MDDTIQGRAVTTGVVNTEAFREEIFAAGVLTAGPVDVCTGVRACSSRSSRTWRTT